ncbi:MAG: ATP-dependent Clp protease ATP-binding subunit [Gemmatimonadetes bacterium]|nr:ATP-dependent Clp protease ATP-binding subunit [Gemmatimonadota bacterium]
MLKTDGRSFRLLGSRAGMEALERAVIGQPQALRKALDVIVRAKMGMSGAHASRSAGKPRGVLFLAGPTGVGKTELAKAITELVFGDPHSYVRFDMSEFGAEHADQRLLGAPPGYVGYDAGGELTNALREKPYCLLLFDEIEKAHTRLLDKFLQLLDEGFVTSGQGERVYCSEAVIVFTSNLGIVEEVEENGKLQRKQVVTPETHKTFAEVERSVREGITTYFNLRLGRPELLNRIGENIVVFDFIRQESAGRIFDRLLDNVLSRVAEVQQVTITVRGDVADVLRALCTADLKHGGRGIGNELEEQFTNPWHARSSRPRSQRSRRWRSWGMRFTTARRRWCSVLPLRRRDRVVEQLRGIPRCIPGYFA